MVHWISEGALPNKQNKYNKILQRLLKTCREAKLPEMWIYAIDPTTDSDRGVGKIMLQCEQRKNKIK